MHKIILSLVFSVSLTMAIAQVPSVNFDQLEPRLSTSSDSIFVVNFWATWCVPCVKELPEFEKINALYSDRKVKVLLVSLDNPRHMESRLLPFIEKHNLKSEIVLLDDPRSNRWIPMVDDSWSGAIPATIIFTSESRSFYEQVFTYAELESIVNSKLN
jgi:thiol-disulfide isomerase/thioredoxin